MKNELVIVLDFGGQYNQLVARRVRECNVYCEIYSYKIDIEKIKAMNPKGIILTGGPNSCYEPDSPTYSEELFKLGIPVLGLCYGAQLMSHVLGGKVEKSARQSRQASCWQCSAKNIRQKRLSLFCRFVSERKENLSFRKNYAHNPSVFFIQMADRFI